VNQHPVELFSSETIDSPKKIDLHWSNYVIDMWFKVGVVDADAVAVAVAVVVVVTSATS